MSEAAPPREKIEALVDVEWSLLGLCLRPEFGRDLCDDLARVMRHFTPLHQKIALAIVRLTKSDIEVTPASVALALKNDSELSELGGVKYLRDRALSAPAVIDEKDARVRMERLTRTHAEVRSDVFGAQCSISANPFKWIAPEAIPPRRFLFESRHAIVGHVSVTGAFGGTGKSSLLIVEALAHVTGRNLLDDRPLFCGNAWYLGFEDALEEHTRRVAATALLHKIDPGALSERLFLNDVTDSFLIAREDSNGVAVAEPVVDALIDEINRRKITFVIVDPFVASHNVRENDNGAIDTVARQWVKIASQTGCAVELVHHLRKGSGTGSEPSADDFRGASSLVPAVRAARLIRTMSKEEGVQLGVIDRLRFFQMVDVKRNMAARSAEQVWRQLTAIDLRNGKDGPSDHVAAVERWQPPDAISIATADDLNAILAKVGTGEWRESPQSSLWVGKVVAEVLELDVTDPAAKDNIRRAIKAWIADGTLAIVQRQDANRRSRPFVTVPAR